MRSEDEDLRRHYLLCNAKGQQDRMEEESKEIREAELEEKWQKHVLETNIEKQQLIMQLMEAATLRGKGGKKKKKKKK